jgi:hypothetical protein
VNLLWWWWWQGWWVNEAKVVCIGGKKGKQECRKVGRRRWMGKDLFYGMIKGFQLAQEWWPAAAVPFPELANGVKLPRHLGTTPPPATTKLEIHQEWVPELGLARLQSD